LKTRSQYFSSDLKDREHIELTMKGYLKIKFEIELSQLKDLDSSFREGTEVVFDYKGNAIKTLVSSIDVGEETTEKTCKVFLGLTLK
jgi:hypothetical protein